MPALGLVRKNKIQKSTVVERLFYRGSGLVLWRKADKNRYEYGSKVWFSTKLIKALK